MLNGKTAKGMEQITVKFPLTYSILLVPATRDLRFRFVIGDSPPVWIVSTSINNLEWWMKAISAEMKTTYNSENKVWKKL